MASDINMVVGQIIGDLDLNERVRLANLPEDEVEIVEKVLERYLSERLHDAAGENRETTKIVRTVWDKLRNTHIMQNTITFRT